jgi:hypothetical protein
MIEGPWCISGEETLGIPFMKDPECPRFNMIPITPIMDTQLDQITIQCILEPLRLSLLRELEEKVKLQKPELFFEIFLTVFVLLCSIERNAVAQATFARTNKFEVSTFITV